MNEYQAMWKNFLDFSNRTSVRGYWMAFLFNLLAGLVLGLLGGLFHLYFLSYLYSLAALIPGLALSVRRLRDSGKEWYWIFTAFVPVVGWIWLIVLLCQPSVPDNGIPTV